MDERITSLIENYRHGSIDRRNFLKKLTLYTGSAAAAMAYIPGLGDKYDEGRLMQETDQSQDSVEPNFWQEPVTAPGRTWVVNQKYRNAGDTNSGSKKAPLKTINAAAQLAQPGDTVLVHEGVYRELIEPARGGEEGRPITYTASPGEIVYIKGSNLYQGRWELTADDSVYRAALDVASMGGRNPYTMRLMNYMPDYEPRNKVAAGHMTLGQVCVDGVMLDEVDNKADLKLMPGTWMASDAGANLLVHFPAGGPDPSRIQVEYTVRKAVLRPGKRGLGYITIRGFRMEHAANEAISQFWTQKMAPQAGLVSCRSGHHWVVENNHIRWARGIGIDVGSERQFSNVDGQPSPRLLGYHIIRNNIISDNGQAGLCGLGHIGTQILNNVFERNNNLGGVAWEEAAIKTHFFINGRIEGNLIRDNYTNGIWLDNTYQNIRITRNVIINNAGSGIFCEMGGGPALIDNNVIGLSATHMQGGSGIYAHDAGGITIAHNLLLENAGYGVLLIVVSKRNYTVYPPDIKSFDQQRTGSLPCLCSNQRVFNNIFLNNHRGSINLPMEGPNALNNTCDYNVFATGSMKPVDFQVSIAGGTGIDQIREALSAAEEKAGIATDQRSHPTGNERGLLLSLEQWRMLMKMDQHSVTASIANESWQVIHAGPGPWLAFRTLLDPSNIGCNPIEDIDKDFYGNPISRDHVMPGPFQNLDKSGDYRFRLWPIGTGIQNRPE